MTAGSGDRRAPAPRRHTRFSFPRTARVRKRGAFLEIQREGKKLGGAAVLMFTHPQRKKEGAPDTECDRASLGRARLGVTVSRRVGGAVVRNRIKRLLREVFRLHPEWFADGRDYVFVARPSAAALDFAAMSNEVQRLCARGAK